MGSAEFDVGVEMAGGCVYGIVPSVFYDAGLKFCGKGVEGIED